MTSRERLLCLQDAVDHVTRNGICGAIVECGVWRGGSMMLAALRLLKLGAANRELWLYDTFEGMTPPSDEDVDHLGRSAAELLRAPKTPNDPLSMWCFAPRDEVAANMDATGYPAGLVRFVEGPIERTVPGTAPKVLSLLRLDTDWYGSTLHALVHLYPRLASGGVLIVDDYGHWRGARKAVDEFVRSVTPQPFLQRVDYTARCGVKP